MGVPARHRQIEIAERLTSDVADDEANIVMLVDLPRVAGSGAQMAFEFWFGFCHATII